MFFFAGHGVTSLESEHELVLEKDMYYPIVTKLRAISLREHCYVLCILDCCRKTKPAPVALPKEDHDENDVKEIRGKQPDMRNKYNLIVIFGCQIANAVALLSNLSEDFFVFLCSQKDALNQIVLPDKLIGFGGSAKTVDLSLSTRQKLMLKWEE